MTGWRLFLTVAVLGFAIGSALAWLTNRGHDADAPPSAGAGVGDPRPGFRLDELDGEPVEAARFDGRPLLVNFWATWCAPCRREMPVLQEASERHGESLSVVGIAMDDPGPVRDFVADVGVDYTILVGRDAVLEVQRDWGNASGALPYTVLVDAEGIIRWRHHGEVTSEELAGALGGVL